MSYNIKTPLPKPKLMELRDFNKINSDGLLGYLTDLEWFTLYNTRNCDIKL